jgi:hypothetical protein
VESGSESSFQSLETTGHENFHSLEISALRHARTNVYEFVGMDAPEKDDAEIARLRSENGLLRDELVALFFEEEELLHVVRPNILRLREISIGAWELRLIEADVRLRRLRRKIEEIRAATRLGHSADLAEIEQRLDREFAEWQQRIRTRIESINATKQTLEHLMTDADAAEFNSLYRGLVKKLHPDLSPDPRPETTALWARVREAHSRHDFAALRALELIARDMAGPSEPQTGPSLANEQTRLKNRVKETVEHLSKIRKQHPFTLEKLLLDNVWVAQQRDELNGESSLLERQATLLEIELAKLLPAISPAQRFGPN